MADRIQKLARVFAKEALRDTAWAYENSLLDYDESDEDYISAKEFLNQPLEKMVEKVTDHALFLATYYQPNAKFAGRAYIEDFVKGELEKEGYPKQMG